MEVLPRTTHLIATHTQTQKVSAVLQRRASEVWVLHPDWIIYCRWSLSRCHEATFMLNQLSPGQALPSPKMDYTPIAPPPAPSSSCSAATTASTNSQRTATAAGENNTTGVSQGEKKDNEGKSAAAVVVLPAGARKRPRDESPEEGEVAEPQPNGASKKTAEAAGGAPAVKRATPAGSNSSSSGPVDSMLSTLSRLKAVGAGAASAPKDAFLLPHQLLAQARSAQENSEAARRGPSPVFGDANRKKQLSQLLAQSGNPPQSTTASAPQQKASSAGQMGVIKKKVNALVLERDSSGEEVREGADRKSSGATGKTAMRPPISVPVARPEDIDTSYRISFDAAANSDDDYFSLDYSNAGQDAEEARELGEVDSAQGSVSSRSSSANGNANTTGHSTDNSLLGEGDGEYATLQDEEGAELLEGDSVTADEGMLCCDDDQGSTCSATAEEGGQSWGQCKMRRLREQHREMAADLDAGDEGPGYGGAFQSSVLPGAVPLQRIDSACSASGAQNSSSEDDDCSDFEVMMNRQRTRMQKETSSSRVDSGDSSGGVSGGTADCPIVIDT